MSSLQLKTVLHFQMIMAMETAQQRFQQRRAFSALAEDRVQLPTPVWLFTTTYNSSSWGSDALSWPPRALHACGAQVYMQAKTHTHKK